MTEQELLDELKENIKEAEANLNKARCLYRDTLGVKVGAKVTLRYNTFPVNVTAVTATGGFLGALYKKNGEVSNRICTYEWSKVQQIEKIEEAEANLNKARCLYRDTLGVKVGAKVTLRYNTFPVNVTAVTATGGFLGALYKKNGEVSNRIRTYEWSKVQQIEKIEEA